MSRLSKTNTVLFVEPPVSLLTIVKKPRKKRVREVDNLTVYSPLGVPFGLHKKYKFFKEINRFIVKSSVKRKIKKYRLFDPVLWFYDTYFVNLIGKLNEKMIIYDCIDDHSAFTTASKEDILNEKKLIENSDIVFVSSEELYKNKSGLNKNTYFVPNAADIEHFGKALSEELQIPEDISRIQTSQIGYMGGICDWLKNRWYT